MGKDNSTNTKIKHAIGSICWNDSHWTGLCPGPKENTACKSYGHIRKNKCPRLLITSSSEICTRFARPDSLIFMLNEGIYEIFCNIS